MGVPLQALAAVAGLPHWFHADLGRAEPGDPGEAWGILKSSELDLGPTSDLPTLDLEIRYSYCHVLSFNSHQKVLHHIEPD